MQGISRAGIGEDRWYRFYDAAGAEARRDVAEAWTTILYTPHGCVAPAKNYLISDADYVEVLTEIDIQTPIPDIIKHRRTERAFLFLGCRFHDQMLRNYARQITKRSRTPHLALVNPEQLTKNELKFLLDHAITPHRHSPAARDRNHHRAQPRPERSTLENRGPSTRAGPGFLIPPGAAARPPYSSAIATGLDRR